MTYKPRSGCKLLIVRRKIFHSDTLVSCHRIRPTFLKLGRESAALEQCEFLKRLDTSKERELRDAIAAVMPQSG
jgi:hypothetical protein